MPELALDDVQRHALAGELERVRVAQLVRRKPASDARPRRDLPELGADARVSVPGEAPVDAKRSNSPFAARAPALGR